MSPKSAVATVSTVFFLAACASFDNKTGAEKFSYSPSDKDMAVVVLSAGAADMCVSFATRLKLLAAGSPYGGSSLAFLPVDSYVVKSEYADHHGYLHVLRLKPGRYYFAPYINNPSVRMTQVPRADFAVSAGEVVYLGEYYLRQHCGISNSGVFLDRSDRDLALLKSKNPALSQATIQKRILSVTGQVSF